MCEKKGRFGNTLTMLWTKELATACFLLSSCILTEVYFIIVNAVVTKLSCSGPCVPQIVQYHCETDSVGLLWTQNSVNLGGASAGFTVNAADGYNVTIASIDGGGLSSNITFLADGNNGTTIYCEDQSANPPSTKKCSLIIAPVPVIENLLFTALSNNSVLLYWTFSPVSPDCTTFYTIQVNETNSDTIVQTENTTEAAVSLSSLMTNTNYSYRVAGIDNAGRMGKWSVKQCFQLKVPGPVNILMANSKDIQDKILTVEWTEHESDISQCVPTVNGYTYTVYANNSLLISGETKLHNQTTLTISDIQQGETYVITVIAVNAVGEGEPAKITISIPSATSPSTGTDSTMTASTFTILSTTVVPAGNPIVYVTTTPTSMATGFHCSVSVLLSVCVSGVLSSAVTALITSIVVCLVMKKRQGTQDTMKTTLAPPPPIYDTVTETAGKESIELTGNVAYAHVNI